MHSILILQIYYNKFLLHEIAEVNEQVAYLEWILNGRDESLSVLLQKLSEVASRIKA